MFIRKYNFWFSDNETAPHDGPDDFMLTAADVSTSSHRIEAENLCAPVYVSNAGVVGVNLIPSLVALVTVGVGMLIITVVVIKKKRRSS